MIQVRHSTSPRAVTGASAADLRDMFALEGLFVDGEVRAVYTHDDRLVLGGAVPRGGLLELPAWEELGEESALARRELGVVNVGAAGAVLVDGEKFELDHLDGLYVGRGAEVAFDGPDAAFYFASAPAHATHPTAFISHERVEPVALGAPASANERRLFRYAWGQELVTANLQFGVTVLSEGSVWNTFPPHLHDRRTEAYLYVDLAEQDRVFHFLGEPGETRHLVLGNRQGVISPPWSIHSGAGTGAYAFIWAMAGENNCYTDLSPVALEDL